MVQGPLKERSLVFCIRNDERRIEGKPYQALKAVLWIRIRIRIRNPDPDPGGQK
jgi:hypothetical protein